MIHRSKDGLNRGFSFCFIVFSQTISGIENRLKNRITRKLHLFLCQTFSDMKYYLIAGEASGDLHAANLMRAIRECDPQAEFRFWGGDAMQQVGGTLVRHYREMAYMGFCLLYTSDAADE